MKWEKHSSSEKISWICYSWVTLLWNTLLSTLFFELQNRVGGEICQKTNGLGQERSELGKMQRVWLKYESSVKVWLGNGGAEVWTGNSCMILHDLSAIPLPFLASICMVPNTMLWVSCSTSLWCFLSFLWWHITKRSVIDASLAAIDLLYYKSEHTT